MLIVMVVEPPFHIAVRYVLPYEIPVTRPVEVTEAMFESRTVQVTETLDGEVVQINCTLAPIFTKSTSGVMVPVIVRVLVVSLCSDRSLPEDAEIGKTI